MRVVSRLIQKGFDPATTLPLRCLCALYEYEHLTRRAADAPDHPFTILEARGIRARTYRIRYCFESEDVPASPFAQEMWHASWQIKTKGGIRVEAVDATVREFELRNTPGMTPRQVRLLKGECGVASCHVSVCVSPRV